MENTSIGLHTVLQKLYTIMSRVDGQLERFEVELRSAKAFMETSVAITETKSLTWRCYGQQWQLCLSDYAGKVPAATPLGLCSRKDRIEALNYLSELRSNLLTEATKLLTLAERSLGNA